MPRASKRAASGIGRITSGIVGSTLLQSTLDFVKNQLPAWRDDPSRADEESEERLNAQLCKFLSVQSRHQFPMVYFHHEEKQTETRRVDFSALPVKNRFVGSTYCTIYDPFVVFEGKRLPAPRSQPKREREYVTGGNSKSGGIQRFKLGLHGAKLHTAALVGYIQEGEPEEWLKRINKWIRDLAESLQFDLEKWNSSEQLSLFMNDAKARTASASSSHPRIGTCVSESILLQHFWVEMKARRFRPAQKKATPKS